MAGAELFPGTVGVGGSRGGVAHFLFSPQSLSDLAQQMFYYIKASGPGFSVLPEAGPSVRSGAGRQAIALITARRARAPRRTDS